MMGFDFEGNAYFMHHQNVNEFRVSKNQGNPSGLIELAIRGGAIFSPIDGSVRVGDWKFDDPYFTNPTYSKMNLGISSWFIGDW